MPRPLHALVDRNAVRHERVIMYILSIINECARAARVKPIPELCNGVRRVDGAFLNSYRRKLDAAIKDVHSGLHKPQYTDPTEILQIANDIGADTHTAAAKTQCINRHSKSST